MEIGEKTGLSGQTVSVIVRSLEQEGLVAKGVAQRGRVGPPTIPISLNPEGAYSVGVSFGARAVDIVLINFVGDIQRHTTHPYKVLRKSSTGSLMLHIAQALKAVPQDMTARIAGIGLAVPDDATIGEDVHAILGRDLPEAQRRIERELQQPVFMQNDITAAAGGESLFGAARLLSDFIFFYLGTNLHSRLILNHQIYNGGNGTHYDIGLEKIRDTAVIQGRTAGMQQEKNSPADQEVYDEWCRECCFTIANSVTSLLRFVAVSDLVLSTYAPALVSASISEGLLQMLPGIKVLLGRSSAAPKAVGAASLPYHARLMVE